MTYPLKPANERRQYYRLIYPPEFAPELLILGYSFKVLDLSEKGVRFRKEFSTRIDTGMMVQGIVLFHDSTQFEFKGYILRVVNREAVVIFIKNLPYQKIMSEQVFLQRNA